MFKTEGEMLMGAYITLWAAVGFFIFVAITPNDIDQMDMRKVGAIGIFLGPIVWVICVIFLIAQARDDISDFQDWFKK